jgi:hypothetical protein
MWITFSWLRMGLVAGFCEHCNETSTAIKDVEYLDYLSDYQLIRKISVPLGYFI